MSEEEQMQNGGLSKSEKAMLAGAVATGLIAPGVTLWIAGAFDAGGPALASFSMILAALLSLAVAVAVSVMGESVGEDIVKVFLFGLPWLILHFVDKYNTLELITLGMLIGSVVGFIGNRFFK